MAVHATTWFIVLLLYAIECVVAATGGLEGKILFVNIGLTVGYNAVGLCIVYLIRLRFGKRLSVESEGQRSWITQFASILPPNAEIYVLRLFQALVMFTSFSLAKFIVAKDSYSAGYVFPASVLCSPCWFASGGALGVCVVRVMERVR